MPLKLVHRPKSPYWYIRGTVRGIRVEESAGTDSRPVAEEIRAKREAEILAESVYGRRATCTFAEAALSYLEAEGSRRFLNPIIEHFGTAPLASIDLAAIEKGARKLYPKVSPLTRNRQFFTPTSAVLHHAAKRGWCPMPILERPAQGPAVIRWLTIDEADRLIEAASPHMEPLIVFLLFTGARVGEALWLDWRDVDLSRGQVMFPRTKNGHPRGVPLHPRVRAALTKISGRTGEVFRKPDGRPYERPKSASDTSAGSRIGTGFAAACRRAGIENFRVHDCRHTWATWHYVQNRDLGALMRLGGWRSERMVLRYAHVNTAELAHTIEALPGGNPGERELKKGKAS